MSAFRITQASTIRFTCASPTQLVPQTSHRASEIADHLAAVILLCPYTVRDPAQQFKLQVEEEQSMSYLVARTCTELVPSSGQRVSRAVADLRAIGAYVLLGDPGSGKSESFKAETQACEGIYLI